MGTNVTRHRFTVDDYHEMGRAGILDEDDRVELIQGEIVEMSPISSTHAAIVARLTQLLVQQLPEQIVWVQNPIQLGTQSEPEPDIAVLRSREDYYASELPHAEDVLLLVEVADSSLRRDREVKLPLYAAAGIAEVWVVDIDGRRVEICQIPTSAGYQDVTVAERDPEVLSGSIPHLTVSLKEILG